MKGLISNVIIFVVVIVLIVLVAISINSVIEESKNTQRIEDAKKILNIINSLANQLSVEPTSARRTIDIDLPEKSRFIFSGSDDSIKISVRGISSLKGARIQEGNILIQGGGFLSAYESDIDNDGNIDLVMENPAVLLAIKKLGNETNHVSINTTNIISLIRNKRQSIDMVPLSGIFINEKDNSSYGFGYTKFSPVQNVQSASILMYVNSTAANITYDAIFTLSAGMDFFELEIRNVKGSLS